MNIKPVVLTSLTFSETVCNKLKLYNMSGSHVQKKNYFLFICIFKSQFRVARILFNSSSYYYIIIGGCNISAHWLSLRVTHVPSASCLVGNWKLAAAK